MDLQLEPMAVSRTSVFEKISYWSLLAMTFLLPIFFVPTTSVSVQFGTSLFFASLGLLSLISYIVLQTKNGSALLPQSLSKFFVFFIIVPLVYGISFVVHGMHRINLFGYTFDQSTVGFIVLGFIVMFLTSVFFQNKDRASYIFVATFISTVISALLLLLRAIFGTGFLSFGLFTSITSTVLGSWISLGIFFGIATLIILIALELLPLRKGMKIALSFVLGILIFVLAIVNFDQAWIFIGLVSSVFIWRSLMVSTGLYETKPRLVKRLQNISVYSLAILVVSLVFLFTTAATRLANLLQVSNVEVRPGVAVTYTVFKSALGHSMLLGSGPNTFTTNWITYKPADINSTDFWNTDFSYGFGYIPTLVTTTGILGLLSWSVFLLFFVWMVYKAVRASYSDIHAKYVTIAAGVVALFLWVMSLVYVPSVAVLILTFIWSGLFIAQLAVQGLFPMRTVSFGFKAGKVKFVSMMIVFLALLLVSGVFAYGLNQHARAQWYFQKSLDAVNVKNDITLSRQFIAKAESILPLDIYYRLESEIAAAQVTNLLAQDLSKADANKVVEQFKTDYTAAIQAAQKAEKADPNNYLNVIDVGRAFALGAPKNINVSGAYEEAKNAFMRAQKLNTQNPFINLLLAKLEADRGEFAVAKEYIATALKQKPNYLYAYFLLSQIQVAQNDVDGAIQSAVALAQIQPNDPSIMFQLGVLLYNKKDFTNAVEAFKRSIVLAPDYANAKYFLGLSYARMGDYAAAIPLFVDLAKSNPDNADVALVLKNVSANKSPFTDAKPPVNTKPEKGSTLPVKEKGQ